MLTLSPREVKVLEAAFSHVSYAEAAESISMDYGTFCTYLSRIRKKVRNGRTFLIRMKRYNKVLFKNEMKINIIKEQRPIQDVASEEETTLEEEELEGKEEL